MPVELEYKARLASIGAVRERLRGAGAEYVGRVLETNRLFDRPDGSLRAAGCGLRVRSVAVLDGNGPSATLTYKGSRMTGPFKRRDEEEVAVSDPRAMTRILLSLGYEERVVFEKRRESWLVPPCRVELDELPELGWFVEVEGPNEAAIRAALASMGLAESEHLDQSYVSMVASLNRSRTAGGLPLCFE